MAEGARRDYRKFTSQSNTLALKSQQQGTLIFFAVTIVLLVVLLIVSYVLYLVFPDLWYKSALTCSSALLNTSRKVQVALDMHTHVRYA